MSVVSYKCPACGGALAFSGDNQKMHCEYCEGNFEMEDVKNYNDAMKVEEQESEYSWGSYDENAGNGDWDEEEKEKIKVYTCPSCGAEIITDETTAATKCMYCNNNTVLPDKMSGVFKPDYVIPFKVTKEEAVESLKKFYNGKPLLPKFFKEDNRVKEITGLYVPFWLYDCNVNANIAFDATKVRCWSDSKYNYTETSHYYIAREGKLDFENVPADGSSKADDATMESIEPFDVKDMVDFETAYLSGYLADKYDVDSNTNIPRVNKRIENSTVQTFRGTVNGGYSSVTLKNANIKLDRSKIKYVLMPVWMLNTKYKDTMYTFALNGQTGKVAGKLPISWGKFWAYLGGITGALTAIASIVYLLV